MNNIMGTVYFVSITVYIIITLIIVMTQNEHGKEFFYFLSLLGWTIFTIWAVVITCYGLW